MRDTTLLSLMALFFIAQILGPAMTHVTLGHVQNSYNQMPRGQMMQSLEGCPFRYLVQHGAASTCPELIVCVNIYVALCG